MITGHADDDGFDRLVNACSVVYVHKTCTKTHMERHTNKNADSAKEESRHCSKTQAQDNTHIVKCSTHHDRRGSYTKPDSVT